jgi:ectoine hydroxylase-related dioxygenase (phytanoyl-CoA dioxygenase family)
MQLFNLWRQVSEVQAVALNPELGKFAADLLGVPSVRLYQDSLFVKRSGDGPTMWHSDLNMAPFDSNDFVTCWIPLQKVPPQEEGGSSLVFASASHRDFALSYWSDPTSTDLSDRYATMQYDEWEVGDCTWHHGWTLHCAPGNDLPAARYALSISFVADETALLNDEGHIRYPDDEDMQSYSEWIGDIGWGGIAEHPFTPVVYRREEESTDEGLEVAEGGVEGDEQM